MSFHYWQYFLAIEASLNKTIQYVELTSNNYKTYSIEFARILLSSTLSKLSDKAERICQCI